MFLQKSNIILGLGVQMSIHILLIDIEGGLEKCMNFQLTKIYKFLLEL